MVSFMYRGSTVPVERLRVYEFVIARNTTARVKIYTRAFVHACAEEGKKRKNKNRTNKQTKNSKRKKEGRSGREGGGREREGEKEIAGFYAPARISNATSTMKRQSSVSTTGNTITPRERVSAERGARGKGAERGRTGSV